MIDSRHNRDGFFKYYTPEAAISTLESGSRKWSSPLLFNDPFDNQFDLDFPDPTEQRAAQLFENLFVILNSPKPIGFDQFGSLTSMAEYIRQIRQSDLAHRYTEEDINELKDAALEVMKDAKTMAPEASNELRRIMSDTSIFCVSERNDSILMWSHYAANHAGIVVKFLALAEVDSPLLVAEPVRYSKEMPCLRYDIMLDFHQGKREIVQTLILSKSVDWIYEKEWRVWDTLRDRTATHEIVPYAPEEIAEIYLGCKMADSKKAEIIEITRRKYPKAIVFQAEKHKRKYELVFREVMANE
jgi:hypothetical protein